jgi:hypothetical protein
MAREFSKQQEDSDIDVVLLAPAAAAVELGQQEQQRDPDRPARLELARFPAHKILLKDSPVLQCKVGCSEGVGCLLINICGIIMLPAYRVCTLLFCAGCWGA